MLLYAPVSESLSGFERMYVYIFTVTEILSSWLPHIYQRNDTTPPLFLPFTHTHPHTHTHTTRFTTHYMQCVCVAYNIITTTHMHVHTHTHTHQLSLRHRATAINQLTHREPRLTL